MGKTGEHMLKITRGDCMDRREEMTKKAQAILENLDFSRREADSFLGTLPGSPDKRIACALWQEKFISLLYRDKNKVNGKLGKHTRGKREKGKENIERTGKMLKFLTRFTSNLSHDISGRFHTDFLFLYSSSVHRDIVHELVSQMEGKKIIELEEHTSTTKNIEYILEGLKYMNLAEDVQCILPEKLYVSFVRYMGIITSFMPRVVVTFNESTSAAGIISSICRRMGSVSVNIAHSISAKTPLFQNSPYDYHFVYGEKSKQNIIENNGIIDGEIIPVGALKMDKLFRTHAVQDITKKILIVGSWKGHFLDEIVDYMYTIVSEGVEFMKDLTFVYKPHPLEVGKRNAYVEKFRPFGNCVIIPPDSDLLEVLDSVDMAILGWSAVGLEAAIRRKPVVVMNPCSIPDWLSYRESGFGMEAQTTEDLQKAVATVYENYRYYTEKAREFVGTHLSNPGRASSKTRTILLNLLKEQFSERPGDVKQK
jgi:hypothetical protein